MNKAEAIKHIKEYVDLSLFPEVKEALETLIPELRESEDERIRKELLDAVDKARVFDIDKDVADRWTAWLEKQKEQKPEVDESTKRLNENWMKQYFDEQKPAEWDELQSEFKNINEAFEDGKKEVVAHPERYGLCKPAEWSEEDEKLLDFWLDVIDSNDWRMDENFCKASREFINKLKSFRPQPHWKPSREQMMALRREVNKLSNSGTADSIRLSIRHDNLKKLM